MTPIRVATGSRLHFGLIRVPTRPDWTDDGSRYYGGLGLMIERPGLIVRLELADSWSGSGPLGDRARAAAERFVNAIGVRAALAVTVERAPREHSGLGVGTQLELACARGASRLLGRCDSPDELARILGRGRRSAIGVRGFAAGGFLIDAGKRRHDELGRLAERIDFPEDWRVVLLSPPVPTAWHGERERAAFAAATPERDSTALASLAIRAASALRRREFREFAAAIGEFNVRAGERFHRAQGGPFVDPAIDQIVRRLAADGFPGAGQSSWGPTVFCFVESEDRANELVGKSIRQFADPVAAEITAARNTGAVSDRNDIGRAMQHRAAD